MINEILHVHIRENTHIKVGNVISNLYTTHNITWWANFIWHEQNIEYD